MYIILSVFLNLFVVVAKICSYRDKNCYWCMLHNVSLNALWGLSAIASTSSETEADINARKNVTLWEGDIKLLPGQRAQIERTNLNHLGCYSVLVSGSLKLLEGLTPEVSDSAIIRTKPVEKCGLAAVKLGYTVFGLILGFCVSGSNETSDYTRFEGYFCQDGKGGLFQGTYFMDVYEIGSPEAYSDGEGHYHEEEDDSSMLTAAPVTDIPSSSFAAIPGVLCLCVALFAAFAMIN
uniref:Uncharacterized protein n=1 Tax=Amphimedon queenslandica TaxID=400682 RepID=A0A1X7U7E3_AMPQE